MMFLPPFATKAGNTLRRARNSHCQKPELSAGIGMGTDALDTCSGHRSRNNFESLLDVLSSRGEHVVGVVSGAEGAGTAPANTLCLT